jgi:hypothetical protein
MDLILDIKTIIASYDQEVWYHLYRFDSEFHNYAASPRGISQFIELFTVKTDGVLWIQYRLFGKLHHRDLPAIACLDGGEAWYLNGRLHRDNDLPAATYANGDQFWYQHGQLHRDNDQPALITSQGELYRCQHGNRVR